MVGIFAPCFFAVSLFSAFVDIATIYSGSTVSRLLRPHINIKDPLHGPSVGEYSPGTRPLLSNRGRRCVLTTPG